MEKLYDIYVYSGDHVQCTLDNRHGRWGLKLNKQRRLPLLILANMILS